MKRLALAALAAALALPMSAEAHRQWLLPSMTVLSGDDPWVTVDAAVSNDLFVFEHVPMRLDGLTIVGPDGAKVEPQNAFTGKYRSVFDVHLTKPGTYRIANAGVGVNANWKQGGETKRWRGPASELSKAIPADATEVKINESVRRVETFVTAGAPTSEALKPTGVGLELEPITHPTDLYAGEAARFRLVMDGKPAAGVEVTLAPGGVRYRDDRGEMKLQTDAAGEFSVTWPTAGFWWLEASVRGGQSSIPNAQRSAMYVATVEVLKN
ncbi:MAG: DUF4198 domain-containing protein [Caulobacteraceae bacterium]|nr:DUF4198 domain-containing protein [Caulobacteraceae bacterium]